MIDGFDQARCNRRNKLAALRFGIETTPIRFLGSAGTGLQLAVASRPAGTLIDSLGTLPADDADALARINAMLPGGKDPLTPDDVHLHYCEAASNRLIADRYMFMGSSTLTNIAIGGAKGCAFMNSHRTGGFSTESELPFGKTFSGRYEQYMTDDGDVTERTLLGFYMLRDLSPNGANGPTTNDLSRMIDGGVLADVSVGLWPGEDGTTTCDVCNADYRSCSHYAGTSRNMDEDQMASARAKGVKRGVATYSIHDWQIGEVSGVYDGAVPGAGFAKAYEALRAGTLDDEDAETLRAAYALLLTAA